MLWPTGLSHSPPLRYPAHMPGEAGVNYRRNRHMGQTGKVLNVRYRRTGKVFRSGKMGSVCRLVAVNRDLFCRDQKHGA